MKIYSTLMFLFLGSIFAMACPNRSGVYEESDGFWIQISQYNCETMDVEQGHKSFPDSSVKRQVILDGKMRPGSFFQKRPNTTETYICYKTENGFQESHFAIMKFEDEIDIGWLNVRFDFEFSHEGSSLKLIKRTIHQSGYEYPPWIKNLTKK